MEVLAAGSSLAICEWEAEGVLRAEIFGLDELTPAVSQQAQQPQPKAGPTS